jgi:hypothetical protein
MITRAHLHNLKAALRPAEALGAALDLRLGGET